MAPKRPVGGAYGVFAAEKRPEFAKQCQGKSITAVTKMMSEAWGKISPAEKAPYEATYQKKKAEFDAYKNSDEYEPPAKKAKRGDKTQKKAKDPDAPKIPVGGGYGCFLAAKRPEFMEKCKGQKAVAISKLAGEAWKGLTDAQKQPYEKEYQEKKARYLKEIEAYRAKKGNADGGDGDEDEEEDADEEDQ